MDLNFRYNMVPQYLGFRITWQNEPELVLDILQLNEMQETCNIRMIVFLHPQMVQSYFCIHFLKRFLQFLFDVTSIEMAMTFCLFYSH
mmetsp:Transcript_12154/g.18342  ORF Transcript_12154/g.18342 Transcript_12154/m.18342 type:complete len:88 (+) Transcript_12154:896-1159(+)